MIKLMSAMLLTALACAVSAEAYACSCRPMTRSEVLTDVQIAFRGKVVQASPSADGRTLIAIIAVSQTIKGRVPSRMVVTTSNQPGLCGYPLHVNRAYDFVGRQHAPGQMSTNMCLMVPLNAQPFIR